MFFFLMMINVRIVADEVDDADNILPVDFGAVQNRTAHITYYPEHTGNIGMFFDHNVCSVHSNTSFIF